MANTTLNSEPGNGSWCWLTYFLLIVGKCSWKVVGNYAIWFSFMIDPGENLGCPCFFGLSCIIVEKRYIEWLTDFLSSPLSLLTGAQTSVWLSQQVSCFYLEGPCSRNALEKKCFVILLAKYVFFVKLSSIRLFFSVNIMCGREFTCNI